MDTEQIDYLLALEQKATTGPWEFNSSMRLDHQEVVDGVFIYQEQEVSDDEQWDNAELITALRNNAPELLALARKALATPTTLASFYKEADAAELVALADQLDAMAGQAAASQVPDASGTDFLRLLVKSRPQLTAALRAQAATPAPVLSLVEEAGPPANSDNYKWAPESEWRTGNAFTALIPHKRKPGQWDTVSAHWDSNGGFWNHTDHFEVLNVKYVLIDEREWPDFPALPTAPTTPSKETDQKGEEVGRG